MRKEIARQLIHALAGTLFLAMIYFLGVAQTAIISTAILIIGLIFAYLIYHGFKIPLISQIVDFVERDYERHFPGRGAFLFVASLVLACLIFREKMVVLGAMIVLVYGDAVSTLIGKPFGKIKITKLTLEGTIAGIIVSFAALSWFFSWQIAVPVAIIGMLAEYLPFDDNFTIPLVSGTVILAITLLL